MIAGALEPQDSPHHPLAPWFEQFRGERREARGAPGRSRAIVTIVHDEPVFLPLFLGYYGRFFAPSDIYVLDNETTDGSTDRDGFVRIPVRRGEVDHAWMVRTIQDLQHELLDRYDVVVVCDVDEMIAPTPEWGTLGDYLDGFAEEWVNCLGYEVLHDPDREPPLDLARPVLDQRGRWFINGAYDKAAVATVPMDWRPGFHGRSDFAMKPDPDLRLVHLHRMDYGLCLERHRRRSRRPWAPRDAERGWAAHNRIVDDAAFRRWFLEDSCFENWEIRPEPIRETWRGLF
jgi:hypothetical protein